MAHSEKGLLVVSTGRERYPRVTTSKRRFGIAVVVVEVSDLVDGEELGAGEATQSPGQGGVGVLSGEFVEHVRGGGEPRGEVVEDAVVEEVFHEHRFADAVRTRRILPTIKAARRQSTTRFIRVAVSAWRLCVASDLAT